MTANDSDVSDGDVLTGSQVVRVYGENLTSPFVTLTFGGVEYTPLTQGEDYIEFVLSDNGTATISVDGSPFISFEVEGIVVPSFLPADFTAAQKNDTSIIGNEGTYINRLVEHQVNCVNYPEIVDRDYPYFLFLIYSGNLPTVNFDYHNCTVNTGVYDVGAMRFNVSVIDETKSAWISYQGFIIAVFNYTTN